MRRVAVTGAALVALVASGCGGQGVVAPTPETVLGTVPQAAAVGKGDPAAGKQLYESNGCGGCHTFKPAASTGKVGPDLDKLAQYAQQANHGTLADFTKESITDPNAYVQSGYPANTMPGFTSLTAQQLADLVAFLTQGH